MRKGKTLVEVSIEREDIALRDIRTEIEEGMEIVWEITRKHFPVGGARAAFLNVARMIAYREIPRRRRRVRKG